MNTRCVTLFIPAAFTLALLGVVRISNSQESLESPMPITTATKALEVLKADEGTWDAAVTLWPRPDSAPIKSHAVVTARMELNGMYLEQRFDGSFGPEMGNKSWSSLSYTNFNATTGLYECVRMASSDSPMIVVRGKATSDNEKRVSLEFAGEYMLMGAKATERDVIRHEGPDKCVIESWMSFAGSTEFQGAEMVLTRSNQTPKSENSKATGGSDLRLGNFSVSLAVKDLGASLAFYEKLGFRAIAGNKRNYLIMQNESSTIGLFQGMFDKNILTFNPGWDRNSSVLLDFDDVRKIQRVLKDQRLVMATEADHATTGPASLTLLDPDGNQILIDQHVSSPKK